MKPMVWTLMLIAALLAASVGSVEAGLFSSKFEKISLTFEGGEKCVNVVPERGEVFVDRKPKRVKWEVASDGRYWEIRYEPSGESSVDGKPG